MQIEHVAIWTRDIDRLSDFYERYFDGVRGKKYVNSKKGFSSYFISFGAGCRLEIMSNEQIPDSPIDPHVQAMGITHLAFNMKSEEAVNRKTDELKSDGYELIDGPRHTGDGYYESVFLDPDGNRIELACTAQS